MANNDSLLFVGYEEDTGAVLSVAGVTVLGVRAPLVVEDRGWRPAATKKKFGPGEPTYDAGYEYGYSQCKFYAAWRLSHPGSPMPINMSGGAPGYADGARAGWAQCVRESTKTTLAPISAPQSSSFEGGYTPAESLKPKAPYKPGPADAGPNASSSMFNLAIRGW